MKKYDVLIVGAGAAGMTAAVYTCRKNLKTVVVSVDVGGQTNLTNHIENYPGTGALPGPELMQKFKADAVKFGAEFITGKVTKIDKENKEFSITINNKDQVKSKAVILAFGRSPRKLNIPGEDKFFGRGVSTCATCLPPEENLVANSSTKAIGVIGVGDRVLTIDGTFQEVLEKTERNYEGELTEIKTRFFTEPAFLTPNHPVLMSTLTKGKGTEYRNFKFSKPTWIEAGALKKGDILHYPIIKETKDKPILLISELFNDLDIDKEGYAKNKKETHTSHRIPNKIKITKDFARLAGYYISEGCRTNRGVNFYFNKNEKTYIADAVNIFKKTFKISPSVKEEKNVCRIMIYSEIIGKIFERLFGKYAHNKKIPHWFLFLPKEKQAELVKGIWRGDGCKRKKDFTLVTNSRNLTYQLRDILLRLQIVPSIQRRELGSLKNTKIEGRTVIFKHDKYHLTIGGAYLEKISDVLGVKHEKIQERKSSNKHAFFDKDFLLLPIREVKYQYYTGKVQNISVNSNQTYIAKNFIVHNCDGPLYKNKIVAVIGGGNAGVEGALELSDIATKVYLVHRRDEFKADAITVEKLKKKKNVEFLLNSVPVEIKGEKFVKAVIVKNNTDQKEKEFAIDGLFVEIGSEADTSMVKHLVKTNENNEVLVNDVGVTNCPGIFAAGDATQIPFKQTVISAGDGAKAALACYTYLSGNNAEILDWKRS